MMPPAILQQETLFQLALMKDFQGSETAVAILANQHPRRGDVLVTTL